MPIQSCRTRLMRYLMLTLIIAALYFVSGRLGLLMAIPPGFATAVWPPSGLAVAAALLYGPRVLPGVFLGSALVNFSLSVEQWQWPDIQAALPVAIPIALGSSLQAWVASILVRRCCAMPSSLIDPRDILLLSLLAGPIACLIAASVGTATLYSLGLVTLTDAPIGWFTWWVGDVIGVLVFTPLILVMVTDTPNNPVMRRLQVSLPLVLAFAMAAVVFFWARSAEQTRVENSFASRALIEAQGVERQAANMTIAVGVIKGLYIASNHVDKNEFSHFYVELINDYGGLEEVAWLKRVPLEERKAFEESLRQQGYSMPYIRGLKGGQVVPAPEQSEYFPILYSASRVSHTTPLVGFDPSGESVRMEAMRRAWSEQRLIATAPVTLANSSESERAIILFLPVFSGELSRSNTRGELLGFIAGLFGIDNFVSSALSAGRERDLILNINDITKPDQPVVLYHEQEQQADIRWEKVFTVGSRQWHVTLTPTPQYLRELHGYTIWWVLIGGMLFVWLAGALLLILTGRESLVRQEVIEKTQQLSQALRQAKEASEAKSRFLASMSHELRTPLNSIIGFTSRLVRKADDNNFDKRTLDSLDTIERNGQHLLELINDILDVSKIEAGEMVLHVDTIQVRDVVDEVSKKIAPLLSAKAIDYRVQIDDAVEYLQADQRRLEQILLNLLSNALKFTEQGSITLEVMPEPRHQQAGLRFSVTDTGIGISSEDQQRLFQRFSQIDSRVTKTVEGSGLGLVLVKEFTEIHGGEVEVHSQLGKGSQFGVWLPLVVAMNSD